MGFAYPEIFSGCQNIIVLLHCMSCAESLLSRKSESMGCTILWIWGLTHTHYHQFPGAQHLPTQWPNTFYSGQAFHCFQLPRQADRPSACDSEQGSGYCQWCCLRDTHGPRPHPLALECPHACQTEITGPLQDWLATLHLLASSFTTKVQCWEWQASESSVETKEFNAVVACSSRLQRRILMLRYHQDVSIAHNDHC